MGLKYEPSLDGVRGVAVLMVALHHAHVPGLSVGGRGVDVFFVLSGYLITSILRSDQGPVHEFWKRRAVRLMPALLLMLTVYVVAAPVLIPADTSIRWRDAALSATYLFNVYQGFVNHETALGHMWSLAVEAQFYLVWPFVLPWLDRRRDPALWLVCGWATLTLLRLGVSTFNPSVAYFLPTHATGLLLGAALVYLPARPLDMWGLAGLAAMLAIPNDALFGPAGLAPTVAELATAALLLGLKSPSPVSRLLSWGPLVRMGALSYGIYLWHCLFIHAVAAQPWWVQALASVLGGTALAAISHATVERWAKANIFRIGSPLIPQRNCQTPR